jgi:SAM-dependent methyltransferase
MKDDLTIATYDKSAKALAAYFAGIGPRISIIQEALVLAHNPKDAHVIEVGCGDGRDAEAIVPHVSWYEGFDPSAGLLELARKRLPGVSFVQADALSYHYPTDLDVVFGFASYLHLNRKDFAAACHKAAQSLRSGGILAITLKERDSYQEELVEDVFGKRWFYYYDEATVEKLLAQEFEIVKLEHQILKRKTAKWLVVMAKKK